MTELLQTRPAVVARTPQSTAMTCDVPVVRARHIRPVADAAPGCRPTGRSPEARRASAAAGRRGVRNADVAADIGAVVGRSSNTVSVLTRSNVSAGVRSSDAAAARRRWTAGVLAGLGLAMMVTVFAIVGHDYQQATAEAPAATEVVHVHTGESLSSLAARIAPDQPTAAVVATVRELNDLQTSGLRPGQALLVPAYR